MAEYFGYRSRSIAVTYLRLLLPVLLVCLSAPVLLAADPQDAILGTWLTDDGASKVEVTKAPAADGSMVYTGKLTWLKEPAPSGSPALGTTILADFKATATGWTGGTVYAPRRGKSFPAELSVTSDGRLQLNIKAGIGSRTDYWTR